MKYTINDIGGDVIKDNKTYSLKYKKDLFA